MKGLVWAFIVLGLLVAAFVSTQYKQAFNCSKVSVAIDANNDGQFTYHDVGAVALQATLLPLRFVRQIDELKPLIVFFELKPSECSTPKAIIISGVLLLSFFLAGAGLMSLTLLGLRYVMKYLMFDALKISPSGGWNAILLRIVSPRFVWLVPPRHGVFLCIGLTAILLMKIGLKTTSVKQVSQSIVTSRDIGDRRDNGASVGSVKGAANPQPFLQFAQELTLAINAIRREGCKSKSPAPLLLVHQGLSDATALIHTGGDIKTAEAKAGYRSASSQILQLSGYRSIASMKSVLGDQYCDTVLNSNLTAVGVAGSLSKVTIVLAKPFVSSIADPTITAKEVVKLVNAARATGGLCGSNAYPSSAPLLVNEKLQAAAQVHATDMAERDYYAHQSLDGRSPSARMNSFGYNSRMTAENIAAGQQTAAEVVAGWLKSPGHCENILTPDLREIGVGVSVSQSSKMGIYWVQNFGAGER